MDSQLILFKVNTPIKKRPPLTHNWPDLGCSCLVWTMWGMCGWWVSHRTFMPICVLLWGSSFPACSGSLLGCLPTPVSLPTPVTLPCQCRSRDSERKLRQWDFESSSLFCFPCTIACCWPNNHSYSYSVLACMEACVNTFNQHFLSTYCVPNTARSWQTQGWTRYAQSSSSWNFESRRKLHWL